MYYGQFELDKVIYETFFLGKKNGFFVECGAADGVAECTCKFFEETLGWSGANIEAVPYLYNKLIVNRPKCKNYNVALSDSDEVKQFSHAIHPVHGYFYGNGSIKHSEAHLQYLLKEGCTFDKFLVQCKRFKDLEIKEPIDLFVLDVEGHEKEAISGIIGIENMPTVFCIEYTITSLDMISKMLPMYKLHSCYKNNAFLIKI